MANKKNTENTSFIIVGIGAVVIATILFTISTLIQFPILTKIKINLIGEILLSTFFFVFGTKAFVWKKNQPMGIIFIITGIIMLGLIIATSIKIL